MTTTGGQFDRGLSCRTIRYAKKASSRSNSTEMSLIATSWLTGSLVASQSSSR
ncbi:MAG: hypothetical protein QM650_02900 [Microlunatus sp.]